MLPGNTFRQVANLRSSLGRVKPADPASLLASRYLLGELIRRDFHSRFVGSALGLAWAILQPLSLVLLYWFVFTRMIPASRSFGDAGYPYFLIAGLLPWMGWQEGILRSATSLVENASIVRKLSFRNEILVIVPNATALIFQSIAIVLFVAFLALEGRIAPALLLLPLCLVLQFVLQIGIGWLLAMIHPFFRDVSHILTFLLSFVFYLSPILYPVTGRYEAVLAWNPLTPLLGLYRSALLGSPLPSLASVVFLVIVAGVSFTAGRALFRRMQPGIVDLI